MAQLNGKVAVITGGNSGIGLAIAQRFVREGAYVFIAGRRQDALDQAVALIGENIEAVQCDVTDTDSLDGLYDTVTARKGRVDVLVVNSGTAEPSPLVEITQAHYSKIFDLNVRAAMFTVQKAVPRMIKGGAVVLIGSIAGAIGTPAYTSYNASKAAVRSFARTWTNELLERGIRVNTLSPGPIDTPMMAAATEEVRTAIVGMIPLRRLGKPEEVAAAALFLASEESSFIAGAELCVDGGLAQV